MDRGVLRARCPGEHTRQWLAAVGMGDTPVQLELESMRRSVANGGTLTRRDIEQLLDTCERLLAQQDQMVRILGDLGPAWIDARAALSRLHAILHARASAERQFWAALSWSR